MKFDIRKKILDFEGKPVEVARFDEIGAPVRDENGVAQKELLTWRRIIFMSLSADPKDRKFTAEDKEQAFKITSRAYAKEGFLELSASDVAFLLKQIADTQSFFIYGRAKELFENWEQEGEEPESPKAPSDDGRKTKKRPA